MAASQEQKVDFLLKKIGYVQSKTGIAEDASGISGTKKAPTEENKPSPLVVPSTSVWADSTFIPASPPTSNTTYVGIYTATNAFQLTHDNTVTGNRTFIARSTFGNQTASISGDWIDPSFGADYAVQVYKGDPNSGGVSLSPTGSGNSDEWFFDYSSGILNFNGTNVPSGITTSNVYLIGYKYLGAKGVLPPAGRSNLTTLSVSGLSTFTGNVDANGDLDVDGHTELDNLNVSGVSTFVSSATFTGETITFTGANYNAIWNKSDSELEFADNAKATFGDGADLKIYHDGSNSYVEDAGVGALIMKGSTIRFRSTTNENIINASQNGSVDLYYDNSKKFETTGIGVSIVNGTSDTATIAAPANLILDPAVVGDNTGVVRIKGDLFVDGTQTQINSTTIELADFIVGVATTATSDLLSDGAGIQIGPNNTFLYEFNGGTNPSLKSSENLNVASGKVYQIDQTERLSADTLSLGTGTTIHSPASNVLTLGTNSAERLRITSDGTIQLSNLTSTYTSGTATRFSLYNDTNNHYGLHVGGSFDLNYNAGGSVASGKGEHVFHTAAVERLRINSDGNVGIGSVIPAGKLDVVGHTELDSVNVSGVSTFQSHVHLGDDDELRFGASNDFKIYHDPNDARIENSNGDIKFKNTGSYFFFDEDGGETLASFINDGAANLFYGGSKKFETTNEGVLVSGGTTTGSLSVSGVSTFTGNVFFQSNVHLGDNDQLRLGDSNEFKIIHRSAGDSTITSSGAVYVGSTAKVNIASGYNTNFMARFTPGGSSELYHNYNKVFETTDGGIDVTGHTETDTLRVSGVSTFTGNIDANGDLDVDGHTELDQLRVSGVSTFQGNVDLGDDDRLRFGDGQELEIYSNGSSSFIKESGSGNLKILGSNVLIKNTQDTEFYADFNHNGSVDLYYDNSKKFETTNEGVLVSGGTTTGSLSVSGVSTFTGNIDANGNLDVDGQTELDNLNVTGITTFGNNVNVGGALSVTGNSYFVGMVTFAAGTDGNIVLGDAATDNVVFNADVNSNIIPNTNNAYDLGSSSQEWKDLYLNGIAYIDTLQVHEGSTFTGNIDANGDLDVDGRTELDITNISETLNVVGIATFASNVDLNADLDVDGHTELDNLNVSGVTTTNTLEVTSTSQFKNNTKHFDGKFANFGNNNDLQIVHDGNNAVIQNATGQFFIDNNSSGGDIFLRSNDNVIVRVDGNNTVLTAQTGGIDVTGHIETDTLNVSGVSTFTGNIDANGDLDVDGHTNLDNVSISGVTTFQSSFVRMAPGGGDSGILKFGSGNNYQIIAQSDKLQFAVAAGKSIELNDGNSVYLRTSNTGIDIIGGLTVSGISTFTGNIDANGNLDVDGQTDLDTLNVSDVATFSANVDINDDQRLRFGAGQDLQIFHNSTNNNSVIQETGSGNLIISADDLVIRNSSSTEVKAKFNTDGSVLLHHDNDEKIRTTASGIDVTGHTETDTLNVSGLSTFTGNIDANGDLDVDGHTELDNVNVAGFSTFAQLVDVNANLTVNQDLTVEGSVGIASLIPSAKLDVVGLTKLDDVNVSGASTFTGNIDANGNLDVDGQTDLDTLNVSDTATFTSNIDANGDLDVDGRTELDITNISETLNVVGITTFASNVDLNANLDISGNLDVDGHTELDNVNISGVVTATAFHTGAEGSAIRVTSNTISGPAEIVIDPAAVGDNTGALRIKGDLFVDGTQTQINSTTIEIADFIVGIATTATSDVLADGAGIQIGPNNTLLYDHTNTSLKSSENLNLASGKTFKIDGTDVLSSTTLGSAVVNSSLTNLGTLTALTVSGAIDANGDLDVDGHTELDNLNVSGISTFGGAIDLNSSNTSFSDRIKVGRYIKGESGQKLTISNQGSNGILLEGTASATLTVSANGIVFGSAPIKFYSSEWTVYNSPTITLDGSNKYANIVGNVGLGSAIPSEKLDVAGTIKTQQLNVTGVSTFSDNVIFDSTGSIQIPKGTTGQRSSGVLGQIRYNTSLSQFEGYGAGNAWGSLGGVKDVDGDTFVTAEASAGNDDDTLNFHTAGSIRVAISSTGQVGIGSTIPAATLDVTGNTRLTGILTVTNGIDGIGIQSEGTSITTGVVKTLNFVGSAISAITDTNGVVEIDLKGGTFTRSTTSFTATAGQTSFSLTYTPNFIDVYHNGVRLTASEFTATNGTSVVLTEGAFAGDTIDVVVFQNSALFNTSKWSLVDTTNESGDIFKDTNVGIGTAKPTDAAHASNTKILNVGVVTANNLYGSLTGNVTGNVTGTADLASGLTGTPNITVGTINASTISVAGTITYDDVTNVDSVGIVTARTDVHVGAGLSVVGVSTFSSAIDVNAAANISGDLTIADKIVHDGDTNTAIRFPSADTFSIETAGDERLRVESSGSVGIGTNNPNNNSKLHIYDGSAGCDLTITSGNVNAVDINLGDIDDHDIGRIRYINSVNAMTFMTNGSERIRIFSGGQVAIATATNYAHANTDDLIIGDTVSDDETGITIGSVNQGQIAFADSGDNRAGLIHYQHTDNSMRLYTNGVTNERVRITSAGDIGIGTGVPAARVDLEGTLGLETTITTVSSTSATTIDTLPIATYRSAKFQIQVTQGTSYQTADLLVIHDGSIASSIEYASLSTSEELAVFTTTISGSNLLLQATMGSASSATVKVVRYGVTI